MFDAKIKEELVETKRHLAQAQELAKKNSDASTFFQNRCKELETRVRSEEKAKDDAQFALRQAQREFETLQAGLVDLAGESPFIRVGRKRHLFTSIHTFTGHENGNLATVNKEDCDIGANLTAKTLENLIAGYYNRRRGTR
jgi:multidrug efflux pump subunit AcrA (membrane-fusion protein)